MICPQGVFELKYFFTSGLATASGDQVSNKSVKTMLAELIAGGTKSAPLSDEELVSRLKAAGTMIARRTVAKYRSELNVLPSHLPPGLLTQPLAADPKIPGSALQFPLPIRG